MDEFCSEGDAKGVDESVPNEDDKMDGLLDELMCLVVVVLQDAGRPCC